MKVEVPPISRVNLRLQVTQRDAWVREIGILKYSLSGSIPGHIYFEFSIPRLGRRADIVLLLDLEIELAREAYQLLQDRYPLVVTRDLAAAKRWLREKARGSERFGIVVSSQAQRLKPQAIDVRTPVDPIHWFLGPKSDVRSSYYLEDVATEFQVQGLELDWACVTWDADFRRTDSGWVHFSFVGDR
jgi:hypothetical protein